MSRFPGLRSLCNPEKRSASPRAMRGREGAEPPFTPPLAPKGVRGWSFYIFRAAAARVSRHIIAGIRADSGGLETEGRGSVLPALKLAPTWSRLAQNACCLLPSACRLSTADCQLFLIHPAAHATSARGHRVLLFLLRNLADQRLSGEHE